MRKSWGEIDVEMHFSSAGLGSHNWTVDHLQTGFCFIWKWPPQFCSGFLLVIITCYYNILIKFSSVHFSCSVVSDTLRWIVARQASLSSPVPGVHSNSCPSSRWCHPAISSSVVPFSSCPQSLPASGSFPMSQLLAWGGQSIGVSASASVLPMNTQDTKL